MGGDLNLNGANGGAEPDGVVSPVVGIGSGNDSTGKDGPVGTGLVAGSSGVTGNSRVPLGGSVRQNSGTGTGGFGNPAYVPKSGNRPVVPNIKRSLNLDNGDRYCTNCGEVIFGQQKKGIRTCPRCHKVLHYSNEMWTFATNGNWGRCLGVFLSYKCGMFIEDNMKFCSLCGTPNMVAIEKERRLERKKHCEEAEVSRKKIKTLEETNRTMAEEIVELRKLTQSQEDVIMAEKLVAFCDKASKSFSMTDDEKN